MSNEVTSPSGYVNTGMAQLPAGDRDLAHSLLSAWAERHDARPYKGRWCLTRLVNPRHHCNSHRCYEDGYPRSLAILDHLEMWKGGNRFLITAHPYGLGGLVDLIEFCATQGVEYQTLDERCSWYSPGVTNLVVLIGRPRPPESSA